jgi:hypothetical protein
MASLVRCAAFGLVAVVAAAAGCTDPMITPAPPPPAATPPMPTPVAPATPTATRTFTVSGTVFEHTVTGRRPLPGLRLSLQLYSNGSMETTSDADGRYSVSGVPAGFLWITPASNTGYLAPCPSGTDDLAANTFMDAHVVSVALLSGPGMPASVPSGAIWTSGLVFERTTAGVRPVAGAMVEMGEPNYRTTTMSDVSGSYLLCTAVPGTGTDVKIFVRASKDGYASGSSSAVLGSDYTGTSIELVRR